MSDSLRPHELQHASPLCPSPTPRVHPNPCPLSWWCHSTILSSVIPFSSCPQSFPASGSFPMSQHFVSGGQSIGVSASISVLLMTTQDWSPLGWTGWISLLSKGLSRVFSNTTVQKHQFCPLYSPILFIAFFIVQLSHPYMTTGKTIALNRWTFVDKIMSLLFILFYFYFFISWRLITSQYCCGFCHTLTWISPGFTCIPHPDPPSHLPLHPIPLGLPNAPGLSTCLMYPTWAGDLFHPR